jgi:signal transduction histidine kinase
VSRIESGKLEFEWAPVDLQQLVREVASRLQLSTTQHTIEVDFDVDDRSEGTVTADRDHIEQVLDNLVSNAIKFSPQGGKIIVSVRANGKDVELSVADPGVGIPAHQLEAVFGLFYQAEDPVSRRTGGMGLGLYISKEIIGRHNGRIWAESAPGQGSTFSFSLPRNRAARKITSPSGRGRAQRG